MNAHDCKKKQRKEKWITVCGESNASSTAAAPSTGFCIDNTCVLFAMAIKRTKKESRISKKT